MASKNGTLNRDGSYCRRDDLKKINFIAYNVIVVERLTLQALLVNVARTTRSLGFPEIQNIARRKPRHCLPGMN